MYESKRKIKNVLPCRNFIRIFYLILRFLFLKFFRCFVIMECVLQKYLDIIPEYKDEEMYDFYGNYVHSKNDVKLYLRTWFKKTPFQSQHEERIYKGVKYYQIVGFCRAFYFHMILINPDTDEFIFLCENNKSSVPEDLSCIPAIHGKFKTYEDIIEKIADFYCICWKI